MKFIAYLSLLSALFPVITGLLRYRYLTTMLKQLFFLCLTGAVTDTILFILSLFTISNFNVINIYSYVQFVFYLWVFIPFIFPNKKNIVLPVLLACVTAIFVITSIYYVRHNTFNVIFLLTESTALMIISIVSMMKIIDKSSNIFINGLFWMVSGMLIYFSIAILIFTVYNIGLEYELKITNGIWTIHSIVNIIADSLFAYAFLCKSQPKILS